MESFKEEMLELGLFGCRMFWVQQVTRLAVFLLFWRVLVARSDAARRASNLVFTMLVSMMRRLTAGAGFGVAK